MNKRILEVAIACLLATGTLYAQQIGIPVKRGVITVDAAPSGDCSAVPGQVRQVRGTRETYVCENGSWVRKDLPICDPDPPSGSCSGHAVCLSESEGQLYACLSGTWTAVSGGGSGDMEKSTYDPDEDGFVDATDWSLTDKYVVIGPADIDGDGTSDCASNGAPWDVCCSLLASDHTKVEGADCLEDALDLVSSYSGNELPVIVFAPGTYVFDDTVVVDKPVKLISMDAHKAIIEGDSSGFISIKTTGKVIVDGFYFGGLMGQAINMVIDNDNPEGPYIVRNTVFESDSNSGGLLYVQGSETSPGPLYLLENNFCNSLHYCLDLRGFIDNDGDGTVAEYMRVVSLGNTWAVSGFREPPVDLWGGSISYFSSGDAYFGDCSGLAITYKTPHTGNHKVVVSGGTFYVGSPILRPSKTRADCSGSESRDVPRESYAVGVVGGDTTPDTSGLDKSTDIVVVSGSSAYIEPHGSTYDSAFLVTYAYNVPIKIAGVSFSSNDPSRVKLVINKNATHVYSSGVVPSNGQYPESTSFVGAKGATVVLGGSTIQYRHGVAGGLSANSDLEIALNSSGVSYHDTTSGDFVGIGTGHTKMRISAALTSWEGGLELSGNGGSMYVLPFRSANYIKNFLGASSNAFDGLFADFVQTSNVRLIQYTCGGQPCVAFDFGMDGTRNAEDPCMVKSGGSDRDCDGTPDDEDSTD